MFLLLDTSTYYNFCALKIPYTIFKIEIINVWELNYEKIDDLVTFHRHSRHCIARQTFITADST